MESNQTKRNMNDEKMETNNEPLICLPGQRLSLLDAVHLAGRGTYERNGYIHATLAGLVDIVPRDNRRIVEVRPIDEQTVVPAQGDVVTVQILVVTQQYCRCLVRCVADIALRRPYRAVLRRENVRANEKDRIDLYRCFRPGDVVLARVLPITEANVYQLSTAENELGVVMAHSENGYRMIPISWTEMQCCRTMVKEGRKVARVVPESL